MPKIPSWVFVLLAAIYFTAIRVDTMDVDASQYAQMSREMLQTGSYLQVFEHGRDYLDKPPLLFWLSARSMSIFGCNNLGFKLPSILFALLALYAVYRLTKLMYDEATGRMAALIIGVCQGLFLMTNDIRCDTILMGCVITAIWLIKETEVQGRKWYLVLGGTAFLALGMMAKGPIALMVPIFAVGSDWVLSRKWKLIFNPWHLFDALLVLIFLLPMCYGLYQQFDLHPEKLVNDVHNVSGLKFFFWSQSFGRITGENPWHNDVDFSFLLSNMLWSFLPWIFLLLGAIVVNVRELIRQKFRLREDQEWVSTGGFILTYCSMASSHYQLPHYIFVSFPLCAIMVAKLLRDFLYYGRYKGLYRFFDKFQLVVSALLMIGVLLILTFVFPAGWIGIALWLMAVGIWLTIVLKKNMAGKILLVSAATMMLVNAFVTNYFYYTLLKYEAGSQAGRYIEQHHIPSKQLVAWRMYDQMIALHFYAKQLVRIVDTNAVPTDHGEYVLTMNDGLAELTSKGMTFDTLFHGDRFKVSELTPKFLNPKTRGEETLPYYLIRIH